MGFLGFQGQVHSFRQTALVLFTLGVGINEHNHSLLFDLAIIIHIAHRQDVVNPFPI